MPDSPTSESLGVNETAPQPLAGKTALVTGAAQGIGKACCEGFAEVGVKVVMADVNEEAGKKAVDKMKHQCGPNLLFVKVDVTSKQSVDAMMQATLDQFGRVDILVNNAGILIPRLLVDPAGKEELTEQIWDKVAVSCARRRRPGT